MKKLQTEIIGFILIANSMMVVLNISLFSSIIITLVHLTLYKETFLSSILLKMLLDSCL